MFKPNLFAALTVTGHRLTCIQKMNNTTKGFSLVKNIFIEKSKAVTIAYLLPGRLCMLNFF